MAPPAHTGDWRQRLVRGSTWMIAMRFGVRGLGLISTIILARLLTPADFGIVAMAMLVIGIIEVFGDTGQQSALIRHHSPETAHYDTAWTMGVLINVGLTGIILIVAPYSAAYFHEPKIVPVIQFLSLRVLFQGFINVGVVDFRRNLDFAQEFKFGLARKLITFTVTLILAFTWRSYWALATGTVLGNFLEVALSFAMHAHRPRFNLSKVREIWSYSIWLLVANLGRYFEGKIDEVVVAGVAVPSKVGQYTVGAELGGLPVTEILDPVERALFPNYARVANDKNLLLENYMIVLSAAASLCASVGAGIALVAPDLVAVMLGPQWLNAAPLIVWFALAAAFSGICNTVFAVFNAAGMSRFTAIQTWFRVAFYLPAMIWAAGTGELINFAMAKPIVALVLAPTFFIRLKRVIPITWRAMGAVMWRPLVSALAMAIPLSTINFAAISSSPYARLPLEVSLGAAVYGICQVGLWLLQGRPEGIEKAIISRVLFRRPRLPVAD